MEIDLDEFKDFLFNEISYFFSKKYVMKIGPHFSVKDEDSFKNIFYSEYNGSFEEFFKAVGVSQGFYTNFNIEFGFGSEDNKIKSKYGYPFDYPIINILKSFKFGTINESDFKRYFELYHIHENEIADEIHSRYIECTGTEKFKLAFKEFVYDINHHVSALLKGCVSEVSGIEEGTWNKKIAVGTISIPKSFKTAVKQKEFIVKLSNSIIPKYKNFYPFVNHIGMIDGLSIHFDNSGMPSNTIKVCVKVNNYKAMATCEEAQMIPRIGSRKKFLSI